MDFAEFFCTIGAVAIVGFLINLVTQKSRAERNIEKIEIELDGLSQDIDALYNDIELTVDAARRDDAEITSELSSCKELTQKVMQECDNILTLSDDMLEKLKIISELFDNQNTTAEQKKQLVHEYTDCLSEDIKSNRQELLRLQSQARGKGHGR